MAFPAIYQIGWRNLLSEILGVQAKTAHLETGVVKMPSRKQPIYTPNPFL